MHIIVDAHEDLAWNALTFGRNYAQSALETRRVEQEGRVVEVNGHSLLGLTEYLEGHVALIFGTLFAAPRKGPLPPASEWNGPTYADPDEAHRVYAAQLDYYARLADEHAQFQLVGGRGDLERVLGSWKTPDPAERRVGLVLLMEGADAIREPQEVEWWLGRGVRIVGLAWSQTRYAGGTNAPGPLTPEGRRLLAVMADLGLMLDLSHASDESFLEALDRFEGVVLASHANPRALLKDPRRPERFLSDEMIGRLAERGGVIGIVPYNAFLSADWQKGSDRSSFSLSHVVAMIDHVCQVTGNARHVGIGSDFDGGFGRDSTPVEIDTIADLQKLDGLLRERGYTEEDTARVLGLNWIDLLRRGLPE